MAVTQGESNLAIATREALEKSWKAQLAMKNGLYTRLLERTQFTAGLKFEQINQMDDYYALAQEYGPNTPTVGGRKDFLAKAGWNVAFIRVPIETKIDEKIKNKPKGDHQLINLAGLHSRMALDALKKKLIARTYSCAGDREWDEGHTNVQGLCSALLSPRAIARHPDNPAVSRDTEHNLYYYGGLDRGIDRNRMWLSADDENIFSEVVLNKTILDEWIDACNENSETSNGDLVIIVGYKLFNGLKRILEMSQIQTVTGSEKVINQGFDRMIYNDVEIIKDPYLSHMTKWGLDSKNRNDNSIKDSNGRAQGLCGELTVDGTNGDNFLFILNLKTWRIRYWADPDAQQSSEGPFEVTDFFDQSQVKGGVEEDLAHVKFRGNFTCESPVNNMMRANVLCA